MTAEAVPSKSKLIEYISTDGFPPNKKVSDKV
jgi:hypothetical protein